jgi:hypothetical protein
VGEGRAAESAINAYSLWLWLRRASAFGRKVRNLNCLFFGMAKAMP